MNKPKVINLLQAAKALVAYIDKNQVYDKLADCGCGLYDSYRTDQFDAVINAAKQAISDLEQEMTKAV